MKQNSYKNIYRIQSSRLPGWDYSEAGYYFVTVCTHKRQSVFGDIINGKMNLSEIGRIVHEEWIKTPQIRNYVELDEFIILPNHIHGIIILRNPHVETSRRDVSTNTKIKTSNKKLTIKSNSISSIVNQIKSICTKRIRQKGYQSFRWQPRFHDHIIRSEKSLQMIRKYIQDNPKNWDSDIENTK